MGFETPTALLARLKLGREEFLQRLLTTLILGGPYPRWNTRSIPSDAGIALLRSVYRLAFQTDWPGDELQFVDEFELLASDDSGRGGAPDYAVLWADRLWLIELKTESGSHRHEQIPGYFALARHHYPDLPIDLVYLTPPMTAEYRPTDDRARYAHLAWPEIVPLVHDSWPAPSQPGEREVVDGVLDTIASLDVRPSVWRARLTGAPPAATFEEPPRVASAGTPIERAFAVAAATAADGEQRAFSLETAGLDELLEVRIEVRRLLVANPEDSPLRFVLPWLWRWESGGAALTPLGLETGRELRFSRYQTPRY